ncbi:CLUMA_CG020472, isoform A [Clunio marinus]|uniref:CLUMA_CG020472, isoform A n=1 Tax=Clunio marinus TaxID=568069 RepID=A0A1J1J678_9DIPT|nr:CLUMA_CG020472, isoform A [Clunio marinus]
MDSSPEQMHSQGSSSSDCDGEMINMEDHRQNAYFQLAFGEMSSIVKFSINSQKLSEKINKTFSLQDIISLMVHEIVTKMEKESDNPSD